MLPHRQALGWLTHSRFVSPFHIFHHICVPERGIEVRHIPAWMPGARFKKIGAHYRHTNLEQTHRPLEWVKRRLVSPPSLRSRDRALTRQKLDNTAVPSFTSRLLESNLSTLDAEALPFAATSLFGGGTDTVRGFQFITWHGEN
jgi:hypothetical protein